MAAEEHDGQRPLLEQGRQADEPPRLIRQDEGRQNVAGLRRVLATAVLVDALNQAIDRIAIGRKDFAARGGIGFELFAECAFHVAAAQEGLPQAIGIDG